MLVSKSVEKTGLRAAEIDDYAEVLFNDWLGLADLSD